MELIRQFFKAIVKTAGQIRFCSGNNDYTTLVCRISKLIYENFNEIFHGIEDNDEINDLKTLRDYINSYVVTHAPKQTSINSLNNFWAAITNPEKGIEAKRMAAQYIAENFKVKTIY